MRGLFLSGGMYCDLNEGSVAEWWTEKGMYCDLNEGFVSEWWTENGDVLCFD